MNRSEIRYRLTSTLLQAGGPVPTADLAARCGAPAEELAAVLAELVGQGQVVQGSLAADGAAGPG